MSFGIVAMGFAGAIAQRIGIERLHDAGAHKLDLYAATLAGALGKFEYMPRLAVLNGDVTALLRQPTPELAHAVNVYLADMNAAARNDVLYVLDTNGRALASSNWTEEASFVGMELGYRPYVRDALQRGSGRFYGMGTTSGRPGYYYSQAISANAVPIGIAVVKVNLDEVERAWAQGGDLALVVDASGIVFLASDPRWKFKTYEPLLPAAEGAIKASRQYAGLELAPLRIEVDSEPMDGVRVVRAGIGMAEQRYLELVRSTPEPTWRLMFLMDYAPVSALILNTVAVTLVSFGFVVLAILFMHQRRRAALAENAARHARELAYGELESKVAERTADLVAANTSLNREIAERERAELVLREAQDALIHAGKMAVLGQMSAGITHELNQPLAALRTLSDNARILLTANRTEDVRGNLELISQLTDRMGKITGQLKAFARKAPLQLSAVPVRRALINVQQLLERRLREEGIACAVDMPAHDVVVRADASRLEQVLVNLVVNALDSMKAVAVRRLEIAVQEHGDRVVIAVRDHGPGIAAKVLPRLFEPFVTTKEPGAGLGLGLAISSGIVGEFGGTLVAGNRPDGGAEFTLELASANGKNHG